MPESIIRHPPDRIGALRAERSAVLETARSLTEAEWRRPSTAKGWRVQDVVAHLAAACHGSFTPWLIGVLRSDDVEADNDRDAAVRADWEPRRVLGEYERWSPRFVRAQAVVARTPGLGLVPVRLGELGTFPLRLLASAFVFDHWTHLAYDIAPVLDRPLPITDATRTTVVVEWLLAGLEQMSRGSMRWVDRPVTLTLDGPGGDSWTVTPVGHGRLRVRPLVGSVGDAAGIAHLTGRADELAVWGTRRRPWRDCDVTIGGDQQYGERFLDSVRIV